MDFYDKWISNYEGWKNIFSFPMNDDGLWITKNVRQGKSIAVVYTLCTYWNQFSLGGICKQ